jgi:8-amino-3,8-dideoxy-alpha-D-manno-octulosonate transaminase
MGAFSFQYHKIITAGEGGMITTGDQRLNDRAMGFHDTAACWRPGGPASRFAKARYKGELFPGVNFRMSELTGAVMREQLKKLDGLLLRMRTNKQRIKQAISGINGLEFRRMNDIEGDTGIVLVFFLPDSVMAGKFSAALNAEGVGASSLHDKKVPDWHVYNHWDMILNKWTATAEGCPYTCQYYTQKGGRIEYSRGMNPKTLEYLSRSVHIDIPAQLTPQDCDMIADSVIKVSNAYL